MSACEERWESKSPSAINIVCECSWEVEFMGSSSVYVTLLEWINDNFKL